MASLIVEDRYPLISQRGNFSGKASAFVKSVIHGEWWRASATTGDVPDTVERNAQFHLNQGPVDIEIQNARPTATLSSLDPGSKIGTWLPNATRSKPLHNREANWKEYFIWHTGSKQCELSFSTNPTRY